ncbi:MAG TPA: MFS transporter [Rhizomicrobium sp.]|nr:MFS transporter [Rhizomicrobium sp.]
MSAAGRGLPAKHIAAVVLGNGLEFYDFVTYAAFAVQIGRTFFPDSRYQLLLSLATFGAGFIGRPIGSWFIGRIGDRRGRKPALVLSFALMGVALVGLALTPSYAAIGFTAPVIAVGFRLLQGFALGGQVGPATAYLIEAAPPGKRGRYAALSYFSQDLSIMAAGIVGVTLSSLLSATALTEWGWRIAFLLGAVIIPFGLVMRRRLEETLPQAAPDESPPPPVGRYWRVAALGGAMLACGTVCNYVLSYSTTYALDTLKFGAGIAFGANILNGLVTACFDLASGVLSDRYGRKPIMLIFSAIFFVVVLPIVYAMTHIHSVAVFYGGLAMLCVLQGLGAGPVLTWITESIPPRIRAGTVSVIYAVFISLFGGSTQFIVKGLQQFTGSALIPGYYMMGALVVGLTAMLLANETVKRVRAS